MNFILDQKTWKDEHLTAPQAQCAHYKKKKKKKKKREMLRPRREQRATGVQAEGGGQTASTRNRSKLADTL
jgi:hypothetical protein